MISRPRIFKRFQLSMAPTIMILLFVVALYRPLSPDATPAADAWQTARANYRWQFPQDHWAHPQYKSEWWYITGHLRDTTDSTRTFGFQFTIFRLGLLPKKPLSDSAWSTRGLFLGHVAITDIQNQQHLFSEAIYREMPLLAGFNTYPDSLIAWCQAPGGGSEQWQLHWNGEAFRFHMLDANKNMSLNLNTVPLKSLVLQGPNGLSRKSTEENSASQYYSFTRLHTVGDLMLNGVRFNVEGLSWMDKEFASNQLTQSQVGWDWFSVQLFDGRELMLYALRQENGEVDFKSGSLIESSSCVVHLDSEDWSYRSLRSWKSPESKATYPMEWDLEVPSAQLKLHLRPVLDSQENYSSRSPYYWEGAVAVLDPAGRLVGRGYVELTGYGKGNRPPL